MKGTPFTKTFTPEEYGAHARNFDIVCDSKGDVYVANFEGLLHYDHASWQIFHSPNITRITSLKVLTDDTIVAFDYQHKAYTLVDGKLTPYDQKTEASTEEERTNPQAYDNRGGVWSLSERGICYTTYNSAYSYLGEEQGLEGEVLSLLAAENNLYAGTTKGLYVYRDDSFVPVSPINLSCWQIIQTEEGAILAATAKGVYLVTHNTAKQLTGENTLSVASDGQGGFYAGEIDWVKHYPALNNPSGSVACSIEYPSKIIIGSDHAVWIGSVFGEIMCKKPGEQEFCAMAGTQDAEVTSIGTLIEHGKDIYIDCSDLTYIWDSKQKKLREQSIIAGFEKKDFTHFSYLSPDGISWRSEEGGKGVYAFKEGKKLSDYSEWSTPLEQLNVRAMTMTKDFIAFGGNFGIYCIERDSIAHRHAKPQLFIRSFVLKDDDLDFSYSIDRESLPGHTLYSYRIDNEDWEPYSTQTVISIPNLPSGTTTLQVKCRDAFGIESDVVERTFHIPFPIFLKWYAILFYIILLLFAVYILIKWRTERMAKDNEKLERLVDERTKELSETQKLLVRQEKLAMMGKLIQGLIDRILNTMNYILNFTKLTQGLGKELEKDIQDEKEVMSEDGYEDSLDIVNMMGDNLQKIEEHSTSTTRILKAMEALLREEKERRQETDIVLLLKQCRDMTLKYYEAEIHSMGLKVCLDTNVDKVVLTVDGEQLSQSLMSLIANSIYAIKKKYEKASFEPKLELKLTSQDQQITIVIRDNGLGIEDNIKEKIFDPFFTTKPTAEASGVGLYISKDIIQNHGGEITMDSVKDQYTAFTITLPKL